jgi:hypothetical protein
MLGEVQGGGEAACGSFFARDLDGKGESLGRPWRGEAVGPTGEREREREEMLERQVGRKGYESSFVGDL